MRTAFYLRGTHWVDTAIVQPIMLAMTTALSFTGERFHPDLAGEMWGEHWHRYHFVLPLIAGKKVLDVASGEGYGSALMASVAVDVNGVDASSDAIAHARAAYATRQNLSFTQADCAKLPFEDAIFDVVVSFETIEHINQQSDFLDEIRRVLKPAGLLIMSSPNRAEYSDARGYSNEFHVKELYRDEFSALLDSRFQHTRWYSQRNAFVSLIAPEIVDAVGAVRAESLTISKTKPDTLLPSLPALYFLVLASKDSTTLEHAVPRLSIFGDSEEWAHNDYRKIYQQTQSSAKREAELMARCAELSVQLAALQNIDVPISPTAQSWFGRLLKRLSS